MEEVNKDNGSMTYLEILSGSISYFTNIPVEFVEKHFEKSANMYGERGELMKMLFNTEFPPTEAQVLLDYLKGLKLSNTIRYFTNSLNLYRMEIIRQSKLN